MTPDNGATVTYGPYPMSARKFLTIYAASRMSVWWSSIWQFGYGR